MKQRFTLSDVVAMATEVREMCLGSRVMNVYDVDSRTLVFKLATEAADGSKKKKLLLMEAGSRFLITGYDVRPESESQQPSTLCAKFRAAIRGKRVSDCRVLGWDRVVSFRFGAGESASHAVLEMFGTGNLILCDSQYIMVRAVREDKTSTKNIHEAPLVKSSKGEAILGSVYQRFESDAKNNLQASAIATVDGIRAFAAFLLAEKCLKQRDRAELEAQRELAGLPPRTSVRKKKKRASGEGSLKHLLSDSRSGLGNYGQDVVDHCLAMCALTGSEGLEELSHQALADLSTTILREAPKVMTHFEGKQNSAIIILSADTDKDTYTSFAPFALAQHKKHVKIKTFSTFCACVDDYFKTALETRMATSTGREATQVEARVNKIRQDQEQRLRTLAQDTESRRQRAEALELKADQVDAVLSVINSALDAGLKWDEIQQYVQSEASRGSPLAKLVKSLDLAQRKVSLSLPLERDDSDDDDDDDDTSFHQDEFITVTISLDSTAMAAAREEWSTAKRAQAKAQKTQAAAAEAVRVAEKIKNAQLAKLNSKHQQQKTLTQLDRPEHLTQLWFLKYAWFITSEGYLCLCPHDKSQAQLLLFTHFRPGKDVVVGLEDGRDFPPCVVRGRKEDNDQWLVSPLALAEAGSYVACRSSAWSRKERASAFWCQQIAPCGQKGYDLVSGALCDFAVRGKQFLPPAVLELNLSILFLAQDATGAFGEQRVDELIALTASVEKENLPHGCEEEKDGAYREIVLPPRADQDTSVSSAPERGLSSNIEVAASTEEEGTGADLPVLPTVASSTEEEVAVAPPPASQLKNKNSVSMKASSSKAKQKKKKGRRRIDDSSSDDEAQSVLDVASKRGRRRQLAQQQFEEGSTTSSKSRGSKKKLKEPNLTQERLDAERTEAARAAIGRMSPPVRAAWDKTATILPEEAVASMAFELGVLADELSEVNATEALELFRDAEKIAQQRAEWGSTALRNRAALLSGICRRVTSLKRKAKEATTTVETATSKEDENDDSEIVAKLTANPGASDVLLGAVVVTAPLASSRNYKNTIKLTPGPAKKGKAAKDALDIFLSGDHQPEVLKLIQQIRLNDVVAALVPQVKLQAAKLDALKQRRKVLDKTLRKQNSKQQQQRAE